MSSALLLASVIGFVKFCKCADTIKAGPIINIHHYNKNQYVIDHKNIRTSINSMHSMVHNNYHVNKVIDSTGQDIYISCETGGYNVAGSDKEQVIDETINLHKKDNTDRLEALLITTMCFAIAAGATW
jgi:hypothetical protein